MEGFLSGVRDVGGSTCFWFGQGVEDESGSLFIFLCCVFFFWISPAPLFSGLPACCVVICRGFGLWLFVRKGEWAWRWEGGAGSGL